MIDIRVPILQHLARNWRRKPEYIAKELVRLAENPPHFNYNPLHSAIRDLLILGIPYDQVVEGIRRIRRKDVRENLLSVLPLIRDYFTGIHPDFCQMIDRRLYPVGRGLMVPFEPPMIYGVGGQLYFPWFSFWRQNPIQAERLSLFVTLIDELLLQDPDLENARFEILDFSAPDKKSPRELTVINANDVPRISDLQKSIMLETFVEGYYRAKQMLEAKQHQAREEQSPKKADPDQPPFPDFPE